MKGTRHFPRLSYNVSRGLREIVAPIQTMPDEIWHDIVRKFAGCCAFCGQGPTKENRGIVPDHLIPVTRFGELVRGNTVPACQRCNDSRGDGDWRAYLNDKFPAKAAERSAAIEAHVAPHSYRAVLPQDVLNNDEIGEYQRILLEWDDVLKTATNLYKKVKLRRGIR